MKKTNKQTNKKSKKQKQLLQQQQQQQQKHTHTHNDHRTLCFTKLQCFSHSRDMYYLKYGTFRAKN